MWLMSNDLMGPTFTVLNEFIYLRHSNKPDDDN